MDERNGLQRFANVDSPCLSWDTFCDLVDGIPWNTFEPRLTLVNRASEAPSLLREQLSGPGQYFFDTNPSRQAHEVFWLKLSLFDTLCRQVASVHRKTTRPLLTLDPRHILISPPKHGSVYVPLRWGCALTIRTADEEPLPVVDDMPSEMAGRLRAVPQDVDPDYMSPSVREWSLGREVTATALIQSADPIPDEGEALIRGLVRVHVIADALAAQAFTQHDVFRLSLPVQGKGAAVRVWARKVDVPERGIVLSGLTDGLSPELWRTFERASKQAMSDACAVIYRTFPLSCDCYSLGMLLFRALLGSDARRWERIRAALPFLLEGLAPAVQGVAPSDIYVLHSRIRDRLCEQPDLFLPDSISDDLWWDAMTFALQAMSTIPGFSYSGTRSGEECSSETGAIESLSREAAHLARRARIELFEADDRDRAIQTACDRLLAEFGAR